MNERNIHNSEFLFSEGEESPEQDIREGLEDSGAAEQQKNAARAMRALGTEPDPPQNENDAKNYLEAPYSYSMAQNEAVSLNSGTLRYTCTDFVLPGRNGFNLAIARRYDSGNAGLAEMNPSHDGYGHFQTETRANNHFLRAFGLGAGWQFVLPSIEVVPPADQKANITYSTFLHLEDGTSYSFEGNTLNDHPLQDVTLQQTTGTLTHPVLTTATRTYDIVVSYKNGGKDYFQKLHDGQGRVDSYKLVARQDRFGNAQFFTMQDYGGMDIIDTWGRTIRLQKDGAMLTWTLPAAQGQTAPRIQYCCTGAAGFTLASVTDQLGRATGFEYHDTAAYTAASKFASAAEQDTGIANIPYALLKKITHPTGAQTLYDYGTSDTNTALRLNLAQYGGYKQYFPLRRRRDVAAGREYHTGVYTYTLEAGGEYIEHANVQTHGNVAEKHTFNEKSQLKDKETRHGGALVLFATYTYGTSNTGADYKLRTSEIARQYNPASSASYLQKTTRWQYTADKKADVAKVIEEYPDDAALNQETSMQYGAYSILTEKSSKMNATTTVVERYALRASDSKVAEYRRVYENNVLKEKTQYVYSTAAGSAFCLAQEKRFTAAEGADLESSPTFVATSHSYNPALYTHSPVRTEIGGVLDADGRATAPYSESFVYDLFGRVVQKTGPLGDVSNIEYDALGRPVKEIYPAVNGTRANKTTHYNDAANTITATDENGNKTRYEYTPLGRIARVYLATADAPRSGDVLVTRYEYDELERVVSEQSFDGNGEAAGNIRTATAYTYDGFSRVLTKTIPQAGYSETHAYADVYVAADAGNRKLQRHQKTVAGEAGCPSLVTATLANQAGQTLYEYLAGTRTAAYEYDKFGNNTRKTDARGNAATTGYDYAGRPVKSTRSVNGATQTSTTGYDALGNKTWAVNFAGKRTSFYYDVLGRLLRQVSPFDERSAETKYYYDAAGNLLRQKTFQGEYWREVQYAYDALGRQTQATLYEDEEKTRWNRTRYVYDAAGNKLEMHTGLTEGCDEYAAVKYTYGRFGNVLSIIDALGAAERYRYDKTGRLLAKTDRNGSRTSYSYDALGRKTKETAVATRGSRTLLSERETGYYITGQKKAELCREAEDSRDAEELAIHYIYDDKGRLVSQADPGGITKTFAYDANGNRASFALARGGETEISLTYTYDELNRLAAVHNQRLENALVLALYQYDANGNRTLQQYPQAGLSTRYTYNHAGLVAGLENRRGGTPLSAWQYTYTPDGNQVAKTGKGNTITYEYDRLGRLVLESDPKRSAMQYEYDRFSNRAKLAVSGGETYTTVYEYDLNNRLLTETKTQRKTTEVYHYQYDANGSQTAREWERLAPYRPGPAGYIHFTADRHPDGIVRLDTRVYNGFGELVRVYRDAQEIRYRYRPDGLRHSKTVKNPLRGTKNTTRHQWDGQNVVMETGAEGRVKARYLRGANILCQHIGEAFFFYLHNAAGDVVQRVAETGDAAPMYEYDAFGNQMDGAKMDPNPFRYCEEYYDNETGEIYLRSRYYSTRTGRFSREDPARYRLNWYNYGTNNPVSYCDPLGLATKKKKEQRTPKPTPPSGLGAGIAAGIAFGAAAADNNNTPGTPATPIPRKSETFKLNDVGANNRKIVPDKSSFTPEELANVFNNRPKLNTDIGLALDFLNWGIQGIRGAMSEIPGTVSGGIQLNGSYLLTGATVQAGGAIDTKGNIGFQITFSGSAGGPPNDTELGLGYSAGLYLGATNAPDIMALKGGGTAIGGSAQVDVGTVLGLDIVSTGYLEKYDDTFYGFSTFMGFGGGWEIHGAATYTIGCEVNLYELWDSSYAFLSNIF